MSDNRDQPFRQTLHSAYTFVRGVESNKSASALTLDHLLQEQIDSMKRSTSQQDLASRGKDRAQRGARLNNLEALETGITKLVASVRAAGDDQDKLRAMGIIEVSETP